MAKARLLPKSRGRAIHDSEAQPDMVRLRAYRLGRVQAEMRARDLSALLLFDSVNIRYASGSSNAQIFNFHTPSRALFVPPDGKCVLFDQPGWGETAFALGTIGEVRDLPTAAYFYAGPRVIEQARRFADQISELLGTAPGNRKVLGVDRIEPVLATALQDCGLSLGYAQEPMEHARAIKSEDEIWCILASIAVAETGIARMRKALEPGITENELFAVLHETNIAAGGEWCEYRLLASGGRTNPWGQECSDKVIRAGELVAFDTGMVGPFGYATDMSRTLYCGPGRPSAEQRRLYRLAYENIQYNLELIHPGVSFREFSQKGWKLPDEFVKNRYPTPAHGIGMTDEWPMTAYPQDWEARGYDGVIEAGMTLSVESYIGADGASEGVKLEEQVLVTSQGCQRLSAFPFEEELLA
jgi:Xaa-Pro aminopeptidase